MTTRMKTGLWITLTLCIAGCGGSRPEAADASNADDESSSAAAGDDEKSEHASKGSDDADDSKESKKSDDSKKDDDPTKEGSGGPAFPDNASVAQAIAAVPKGTQRSNIDPETLGEPLNKPELYAPCKAGSQHFKLKVAVWDGKAVGIDIATSNKALADCVRKQIQGIEWRDKVKSLNTVEYSM